ncbi:type IV pilus twitching motility protein PilT [bacterium]|nr:type IV pilus twitching motility protein PilT [bacterium]
MPQLDRFFKFVVEQKASDLHLSSGSPPIVRINGQLTPINHPAFTHESLLAILKEVMNARVTKEFEARRQADLIYPFGENARFRGNVFMQRHGVAAVFRQIPSRIMTMTELGLPRAVSGLIRLSKGLVLVTGPTGSGKSTTLSAMIDAMNTTRREHILTVEDPIEFVHEDKRSHVTQRQVGEHVDDFADALRAALREDPDIILVGEMRDLETISLAITAAETGHLVLGTLHTSNAVKTVDRVIDSFPADQQEQIRVMLSESLKGVVAQALLPRADGGGRIAAYEILLGTPALANLIRDRKTFQIPSLIQTSRAAGMQLLDQSLLDLLKRQQIKPIDAYIAATDKKSFEEYLDIPARKELGLTA